MADVPIEQIFQSRVWERFHHGLTKAFNSSCLNQGLDERARRELDIFDRRLKEIATKMPDIDKMFESFDGEVAPLRIDIYMKIIDYLEETLSAEE